MSKRSVLARTAMHTGLTRVLEMLPPKPGIMIVNHHRIGDANATRFDRAVFSATTDQLDWQVAYLKRRFNVLGGEEMEQMINSTKPLKGFHVAITFDDGYLDNYTEAFDVLRSRDCPAFFFLVTDYVGTAQIPWWDAIAFLVRNSSKASLRLRRPLSLEVALEPDRERAIYRVLQHFKLRENQKAEDFVANLREEAGIDLPATGRRFLNWAEANEMQDSGMTIGSHTLTHRILAKLPLSEQKHELAVSRSILEEKLGSAISTLAYPVGTATTFSSSTEEDARRLGYTLCMSFHGGVNHPKTMRATNLLRTVVAAEPMMFRHQVTLLSQFGKLPY